MIVLTIIYKDTRQSHTFDHVLEFTERPSGKRNKVEMLKNEFTICTNTSSYF